MKKIIMLLLLLFIIACKQEVKEVIITTQPEIVAVDTTTIITPNKPLTNQEQFLQDNGFKTDAGFTDSQFKEFKSTINSGLFKKESFCDVYKKALNLEGNELKKYLHKFRKIDYFETILFMYGPKVCDMTSSRQGNISSSSYINTDESANPCIISEDFIKQDLQNPSTADFSMFDCSADKNSDGTYTILRKVSAKNSFGVEKEFIYKVSIGFKGGNWVDISNWSLINIQSQEYK
jgi:hypothetical protein